MTSFDKNTIINNIIEIGHRLGSKSYTPGYSGNISARCGEHVIITTSGSSNGYLSHDDFVEIDFDGNPVNSTKKPSSEKYLHLEFYRKRPEFNAVIHVHPAGLSAFASANKHLLEPIMAENVVKNTSKYFNDYDAILMANHGVIIGSKTLEDAYQKLEIAEEYAKTVIYTNLLGGAKVLSDSEAKAIIELR